MTNEALFQPAGYCPTCGYPLDPGKCPECGRFVRHYELARVPPQVVRRRRVRWALTLIVCTAVLYGGYRFYRDVNWLPWLPDRVLLWFAYSDWNRADREILRRLALGALQTADVDALFAGAYKVEAVHAPRVPANTAMPLIVRLTPRGPLKPAFTIPATGPNRDEWKLAGVGWTATPPADYRFLFNCGCPEVWFTIPPLPPGQHTLKLDGDFWHNAPQVAGMPVPFHWPVHSQVSVTVEDRPLTDFVAPRWSEELAQALAAKIRLGFGTKQPQLFIDLDRPPVAVSFEVWVRTRADDPWQPSIGSFGFARWVGCQREAHHGCNALFPDGVQKAERIDVQLRPCPTEALFWGFDECFAGTLEWHDLAYEREMTLGGTNYTVPPTRVFKGADEE